MTRLIDADALISDLEYDVELDSRLLDDKGLVGLHREITQFDKDCKANTIAFLKDAPTVDAEPVRYGKWYELATYDGGEVDLRCSNCGATVSGFVQDYKCCPYCEARMELDDA